MSLVHILVCTLYANMCVANKVALVTGAGQGIGQASAILLANEGGKVAVVDISEDKARHTAEIIRERSGDALCVCADVSKQPDSEMMVRKTFEQYGRLDILFNNVGTNYRSLITDISNEEWHRILTTNLDSILFSCRRAVPLMVKGGGGSIINTSSTFGIIGFYHMPAYCASKAAIIGLTKQMALDYARDNIRVNCVCPGATETPGLSGDWTYRSNEKERRLAMIPMGRFGKPEEIASAVLFLASDQSSYVTGSALVVDGGFTAGYAE